MMKTVRPESGILAMLVASTVFVLSSVPLPRAIADEFVFDWEDSGQTTTVVAAASSVAASDGIAEGDEWLAIPDEDLVVGAESVEGEGEQTAVDDAEWISPPAAEPGVEPDVEFDADALEPDGGAAVAEGEDESFSFELGEDADAPLPEVVEPMLDLVAEPPVVEMPEAEEMVEEMVEEAVAPVAELDVPEAAEPMLELVAEPPTAEMPEAAEAVESAVEDEWAETLDTAGDMDAVAVAADEAESIESGEEAPEFPPAVEATGAKGGMDSPEYEALVEDNLGLRRQIDALTRDQEQVKQEKERLAREVADLEQRIILSTGKITELQKAKSVAEREQSTPADLDRVVELEGRLAEVEKGKVALAKELAALKEKALADEVPTVAVPEGSAVQPGSDLFLEVEQENALLKEKLQKIEGERQRAVKAKDSLARDEERAALRLREEQEKQKDLKKRLAEARGSADDNRRIVSKLLKQLPSLEEELVEAQQISAAKGAALSQQQRELETLKLELEKREHRLMKAERMAAALEGAREEVRRVDAKSKRDMYYNMAVVYSKESKFKDAEQQYLHALRLDPNDPEVHYNLGILYDDELDEKDRAAMHYRKYLRLDPHGKDSDAVRGWLMAIEMRR